MALTRWPAAIADALDAFIDRIGRITGWCAFALVLVMAFNVLLRYLFRTGSVAMQELEWHLMAPICMLGLSYAILHDGHVQVDILYGRFPAARCSGSSTSSRRCWSCSSSPSCSSCRIPYVMQSYTIGEKSPDPGGLTHRWIVKAMLPARLRAAARSRAWPRCCARSIPILDPSAHVKRASAHGLTCPPPKLLAILCIVSFFVLLAIGMPVALTLAVSGLVFGYLGFGAGLFDLLPARIYGVTANYTLIAIPLFVFMGVMLEKSKIADDLMDVIGHLAGGLRGGMGIGIILVGVLMGATTGIVGATIVTLGLITLPALMRRGYHLPTACGTICASGTLGQIIPPSTILILLADILGQSVGTLFAAALVPRPAAVRHLLHLSARCSASCGRSWCRRSPLDERAGDVARASCSKARCASACRRSASCSRCSARSSAASPRRPRPRRWARSARSWWSRWPAASASRCCARRRSPPRASPPA